MSPRPWNGGDPLRHLRLAMNRLFEDYQAESFPTLPAVNVWEEAEGFMIEAEVPGLGMEDLEITCQGQDIALRGEWKAPKDDEGAYERRERPSGGFARTLTLPAEVDSDRIRATLEDGVLRIEVPKSSSAKPRKIDVRAASSKEPAGTPATNDEGKEA